jgi:hypothetical protein
MYEECLTVVLDLERTRNYLEQQDFVLHCEYLALCWLLRNIKDVGRLGRWILRLHSFKFKVHHSKSVGTVVPDSLSRMLEGLGADVR